MTCSDCYQKYSDCSPAERTELALGTGRASSVEELRSYLNRIKAVQEEKEEQSQAERQKRISEKTCLRCGGRMLNYGPITLKLGEETFFLSDINRLLSGSLTVHVLRCEGCGKAEFYIPDEKGLLSVLEDCK